MVVDEEEHDRGTEHGGEVHRLVGVPFARSTVAEEREGREAIAAQPCGQGKPGRVDGLRRQRHGHRGDSVGREVVVVVRDGAVCGEHLQRVDAARDDGHRVAVGREQPVDGREGERRTDLDGLLPECGRVRAEAALAAEVQRLGVDPAGEHESPI